MKYTSVPSLFAQAQTYLYNATEHAEIRQKMQRQGFDQRRILEGSSLLDQARTLHLLKSEKYAQKQVLAQKIEQDEQAARQLLEEHTEIVRFVFRKEPAILATFGIRRKPKRFDHWLMQATTFYYSAQAHTDSLARHGLSPEEVAQAQAMLEALGNARNQRLQRKGEAEEATRMRDASLRKLKSWMKDFRTIARVALKDSPQLMEALGIVVKARWI